MIRLTTHNNDLAISYSSAGAGRGRFLLAVHGFPAVDLTYPVAQPRWTPLIAQCSPYGPDTGRCTAFELLGSATT